MASMQLRPSATDARLVAVIDRDPPTWDKAPILVATDVPQARAHEVWQAYLDGRPLPRFNPDGTPEDGDADATDAEHLTPTA